MALMSILIRVKLHSAFMLLILMVISMSLGRLQANTEYLIAYIFDGEAQTLEGILNGVSLGTVDVGRSDLPAQSRGRHWTWGPQCQCRFS